jgi:hypothetical protein
VTCLLHDSGERLALFLGFSVNKFMGLGF